METQTGIQVVTGTERRKGLKRAGQDGNTDRYTLWLQELEGGK